MRFFATAPERMPLFCRTCTFWESWAGVASSALHPSSKMSHCRKIEDLCIIGPALSRRACDHSEEGGGRNDEAGHRKREAASSGWRGGLSAVPCHPAAAGQVALLVAASRLAVFCPLQICADVGHPACFQELPAVHRLLEKRVGRTGAFPPVLRQSGVFPAVAEHAHPVLSESGLLFPRSDRAGAAAERSPAGSVQKSRPDDDLHPAFHLHGHRREPDLRLPDDGRRAGQ